MNLNAVIFVPALAGCVIFGFVFALFAARYYLMVLQNTGAGAREIHWVSEPILDSVWELFYLAWLIGLWLGPAYFIGRAMSHGMESNWLRLGVPLAVFWICYPVSQLSSLSGPTIWLPLHPGVFARLFQKPPVLIGFMGLSATALLILGLGCHWTFFAEDLVWLFIGAPVFVTGGLLYGRLLGRLAYVLAFTRPFTMRKKKKKRKVEGKQNATTEVQPAPSFEQPSELPPIDSPDEGPLTGYDLKLDDSPKPTPRGEVRQRVIAEAVDNYEERDDPAPEPGVEPVHRSNDDDDRAPYGVHEPEVVPESSTPAPVVQPREDELRLIDRTDTPKPPKQVWSIELFAFLAGPGTIVVIGLLSSLCILVGGMVRIARAFDPTSEN